MPDLNNTQATTPVEIINESSGNTAIVNSDGSLNQVSFAALYDGYQPDPTTADSGNVAKIQLDASGRLEGHSAVTSDEGSFRDDFTGSSLTADWTATSGTGSSVSVGSSLVTLASGTTNGTINKIVREGDYLPFAIQFYGRITQRIANQTAIVGMIDAYSAVENGVYVKFTGTTNTQCQFVTQTSSDASDAQTTTVTLPSGNTAANHVYKIDLSTNTATLSIDDTIVATHSVHIPAPYAVMDVHALIHNTGVAASSTSLILDYIYLSDWNRLQIDSDFPGEPLAVKVIGGVSGGYVATQNKTYVISGEVSLPTSGTETRAVLITNPNGSGKTVLFRKLLATLTNTTASQAVIRIYYGPTISANGTAITISSTDIGASAPASSINSYSGPTITANGTRIQTLVCGGGTSPTNVNFDFDTILALTANSSILITGTPDGNNRTLALTLYWDEV